MFVNRVCVNSQNLVFKGFQHITNDIGEELYHFNYPYNYETEDCEIQFFKLKPKQNFNYELIKTPAATIKLEETGVDVDIKSLINLNDDEPFAYRYIRKDKSTGNIISQGGDSGLNFEINNDQVKFKTWAKDFSQKSNSNEYTFVSRLGTTPKVQGAGYLVYPDSQRVGVKARGFDEDNTGEIYLDNDERNAMEKVSRTFSNKTGGNIAGLEYNLDYLAKNGYKIQFANPIAGGDNRSGHHYWNKNNFQISDDMGNINNFNSYVRKMFQKGMVYVYDGTFTSEGLEGVHFQYALRWANKNPQSYYWFKMQSLENQSLGFGVVPENKENLRHRVINPPTIYNESSQKVEKNPNYNPKKETYFQIYDGSQVSEEELSKLDKPLENYENIKSGNLLKINSHDDTLMNYIFEVNPKEYNNRLEAFAKFNKKNERPLVLNSPEGTINIAQFSNFKLDRKTEGGFVAWDANTDMVKMNYHISGYDEKLSQAKLLPSQRDFEKQMRIRGAYEVQDMALQAAKFWTRNVKNNQILYAAQVLKGANTAEKIEELISNGLLPKEALLNNEELKNIQNGYYNLSPKSVLDRSNATIKALMELPLDSLELAENTVGVLSTSYFSNRAINEETLGLSRFELFKQDNPHLAKEYAKVYTSVNSMFTKDIKDFANKVIDSIDVASSEKLIDANGNYTEFGEYVIEQFGSNIARYAFFKSLVGENLKTKTLANGEIVYDYKDIKEKTSLKALGINANSPEDEAEKLAKLISKGLSKLDTKDVEYLSQSISTRINGLNTASFRIAEAMEKKAGLNLAWRLDAAKDVVDQDAVRNRETDFDDTWNNMIAFWKKFVKSIKSEAPNSYIVAEMTDVNEVMRDILGERSECYNNLPELGLKFKSVPDAMIKFFNETGITSEAAYSYFFTDVMRIFACDFADGAANNDLKSRCNKIVDNIRELINTRGVDYVRNLYTFAGNHDKPRILHGLALDMKLFYGSLRVQDEHGTINYGLNRKNRIEAMIQLSNADDYNSLPLEAKLNIDNQEYFRTVSTYAVATSQLLRNSINDSLANIATDEELKYLKLALVDLTNGNYLDSGVTTQIPSINIKEISTVEEALKTMLKLANITISEADFAAIVKRANEPNLVEQFYIHGDFAGDDDIAKRNQEMIEKILRGSYETTRSDEFDFMKYSTYSTSVAGLLRQAFIDVKGDDAHLRYQFLNGAKEFVKKYDKATVEAARVKLPFIESQSAAMAKNNYAAEDFKTSIEMLIQQAEFKARKDGKLGENQHFSNAGKIHLNIWKAATEPAVQKATMMMSFLSGLVGIPTIFGGDELGMSGYDEKAKNIYLKCRNPLPWSELENGLFKDYRQKIQKAINDAMSIKSRDGVSALNNGTAYMMRTSDENIPAFMMQDSSGNMTVSVFNATGINTSPRFDYFKHLGIDEKNKDKFFADNNIESINANNRYVPIQANKDIDYIELGAGLSLPLGLTFLNSDIRDNATYYIDKIKDELGNPTERLAIFKKGGKISLNGLTAKNGTMVLKHVKNAGKRIVFRGSSQLISKQYKVVSNPYHIYEQPSIGENLSFLAK